MRIVLAQHAGACYGVQRALSLAHEAAGASGAVYTLGPLIHNPGVVRELEERGVHVVERVGELPDGCVALIRSHGVTPDVREQLERREIDVVDATCPHVARAQKGAAELAAAGFRVIVVGETGHPEVEGLKAYAHRAGAQVDVVSSSADVPDDLGKPVGVVVQTTQRRAALDEVVAVVRNRGVEPVVENTICSATRLRQDAAAELASDVDAMIIIGGRNSSNTTRLAEICRLACARAFHIESADEIDPAWLEGCDTVGVTAGASTPDEQIQAVLTALRRLPLGEATR